MDSVLMLSGLEPNLFPDNCGYETTPYWWV